MKIGRGPIHGFSHSTPTEKDMIVEYGLLRGVWMRGNQSQWLSICNQFKKHSPGIKMSQYAKYKDLGDKEKEKFEPSRGAPSAVSRIVSITDNRHKKEIVQGHKVCVVDIYADWCGPCKQVAPKFAKLAEKYYKPGVCIFAKEDVELELTPGLTSIPVFHFFHEGKFVGDVIGADIVEVENKVRELIALPSEI